MDKRIIVVQSPQPYLFHWSLCLCYFPWDCLYYQHQESTLNKTVSSEILNGAEMSFISTKELWYSAIFYPQGQDVFITLSSFKKACLFVRAWEIRQAKNWRKICSWLKRMQYWWDNRYSTFHKPWPTQKRKRTSERKERKWNMKQRKR